MPKAREETEQALRLKFKKIYGKEPNVLEFQQFKKNYHKPINDDEFKQLPEGKEDDDHPFLRNTRPSFRRRRNQNSP
jgi:hypothetical protein